MSRFGKTILLAFILLATPAAPLAVAGSTRLIGTWQKLPNAPVAADGGATAAWTGKQLIVYGRRGAEDVAASYDPATAAWTKLATPDRRGPAWGYRALWTGRQLLLLSPFGSDTFDPATKTWRSSRRSVPGGLVVWTGREAIGWGGGCCGDARADGAAYDPRRKTFRKLPRGPLAPSQGPVGAWDGRELLLFVSGLTPDGKPYSRHLARAAAYNPATNRWRRIARVPAQGGTAAWDGRDLLVVGAGKAARAAYAYRPATNRWRRLAALPSPRRGGTAVWTGSSLIVWGGDSGAAPLRDGVAYDARANTWSTIPHAPLRARDGAVVVWTGRSLIVWGGVIGTPAGTSTPPKAMADGAAFTTRTP